MALAAFVASSVFAQEPEPSTTSNQMASGGNGKGYDMAPETRPEVVQSAADAIPAKNPDGPFQPTWDSLKANYQVPAWLPEAKFGLFMHWGLYAVPAYHNEWYEKHMYASFRQWHEQTFGPVGQFGYKDFIPRFTNEKFDPAAWAELFKKSGAKFVVPTAQHHDNFALWDSQVTPFNAKAMGPKRDLIGDLAKAVRAQGLKFGVSNHGIENFQFINPAPDLLKELKEKKADLFDPNWTEFYNVADRSDEACKRFLLDWYARNVELIDKYQPDMLWFDNGVDQRFLDPLKLRLAAYYYNRAKQWGKEVTLCTKKAAYAPSDDNTKTIGSVIDFEKVGNRSPAGIRPGVWVVDDPIGSTWGYTSDMRINGAGTIIGRLADTASKNGNYLLNLSPRADGTFAPELQNCLLEIGQWMDVNGEAIYGTHNWVEFKEGGESGLNVRFTAKGDDLYAIILGNWPGGEATIKSLGESRGKATGVSLLGGAKLEFTQNADGLKVTLPPSAPAPCKYAYTLKVTGLKMNVATVTKSGNPE